MFFRFHQLVQVVILDLMFISNLQNKNNDFKFYGENVCTKLIKKAFDS